MPSMSYCKFENTEMELAQCVEAMEQAGYLDELDMNDYEQRAFLSMWRLCKTFLAEHERLMNSEFVV
jgi:hypothetical protein